ncbi:unnamed protein product [Acanthoscelides obtectus]|uniref:Uncharacterized protein n=1 Tax=Acanthoscelides obtectus TaxID=200917 RepID=A0A9P0LX27_ACAOB|nr:unnamed protein product [Acanthoscelides obtectus]CAK1646623.1 hypothetical protein AOBTE_LOCUS14758 [Acanthoscelides obtectus]
MDHLNMTGDTTQQNPPSVFGFDHYPPQLQVNWNQSNPFGLPTSPTCQSQFNPGIPAGIQSPVCSPQPVFHTAFNPIEVPQQNQYAPTIQQQTGSTSYISTSPPNLIGHQFGFNVTSFSQPQPSYSFGPKPSTSNNEVVQFPFQAANLYRCKRKTDSPPLQPSKQHVTEEKMAEHMSKLHINSESAPKSETTENQMKRLYMCEEMRKLQTEPILPNSIIHRFFLMAPYRHM